jgi:hypothetical protein
MRRRISQKKCSPNGVSGNLPSHKSSKSIGRPILGPRCRKSAIGKFLVQYSNAQCRMACLMVLAFNDFRRKTRWGTFSGDFGPFFDVEKSGCLTYDEKRPIRVSAGSPQEACWQRGWCENVQRCTMGEKLKQMAHVENSVAHLMREVVTDVFDRSQIGRDSGRVVTYQLFVTIGCICSSLCKSVGRPTLAGNRNDFVKTEKRVPHAVRCWCGPSQSV